MAASTGQLPAARGVACRDQNPLIGLRIGRSEVQEALSVCVRDLEQTTLDDTSRPDLLCDVSQY